MKIFLKPVQQACLALCSVAVLHSAPLSDPSLPQPVPFPPAIVKPADTPYRGVIALSVDATDFQRRIVNVRESIPVHAGALTLLYPEWIPGDHSPTGPVRDLGGLIIRGNGTRIQWVRDQVNVFAFHVAVPAGVTTLQLEFQYLGPVSDQGRIAFSSKILDLAWNTVLLYPAGHFARQITFAPRIRLPDGWQFASALTVQSQEGREVQFAPTPLHTLIDSPLYAGLHCRKVDLSTGATNHVTLNVFADAEADLAITPEQLKWHQNLTDQAQKLYASHHYDHYDFLFLLSDVVGGIGLEHHQSSEDGERSSYFKDWSAGVSERDLLAHEYTHSWNGKFRRPADLWTPDFNTPMRDDLLWVYEGMTQYWGYVLTARSGLRTATQTEDLLAIIAANDDASPGRTWRPLVDTTNQPTISQRSPVSWVTWQRPEDYYNEGMLIWLDADTKIRELSGDTKSLDDFAKLFFGVNNGSFVTVTYTFEDVVAALQAVQPFDWATFLKERVYQLAPHTPEDGFTRGGYRLTYSDTPPDWLAHNGKPDAPVNLGTSIGFSIKADGSLVNVWWGSPAFDAGITPGMTVTAVNGTAYSIEHLRNAIVEAEKGSTPIRLLIKRDNEFQTIDVAYHGGLRYPKLSRVEGTRDRLSEILAPK